MTDQSTEHLVDAFKLCIELGPTFLCKIPKPLGQLQLCIQLAERTLRHVEVIDKFFLCLPRSTFCDVAWNA